MKKILLILIFFSIIISSCQYFDLLTKKEWMETADIGSDNVTIFISGRYSGIPCFWKINNNEQKRINLEYSGANAEAIDICVVGKMVYVSGWHLPGVRQACYWVNGKIYNLNVDNPANNSVAYEISVKGGVIFTSGYEASNAVFWINQNMGDLNIGLGNSTSECLFVQQESSSKFTTYVGGRNDPTGGGDQLPCYWNGGQINYLEEGGGTNVILRSIYKIGSTIYSCGQDQSGAPQLACSWKNKKITHLPVPLDPSGAEALFVSMGDVYIAGYYSTLAAVQQPCYWKNNNFIPLPSSNVANDSVARSIYVFNDNIYITGVDNGYACYWINGDQIFLESNTSIGNTIIVKAK